MRDDRQEEGQEATIHEGHDNEHGHYKSIAASSRNIESLTLDFEVRL